MGFENIIQKGHRDNVIITWTNKYGFLIFRT